MKHRDGSLKWSIRLTKLFNSIDKRKEKRHFFNIRNEENYHYRPCRHQKEKNNAKNNSAHINLTTQIKWTNFLKNTNLHTSPNMK